MSRQSEWQAKMRAAGLCIQCAKPRTVYKNHCNRCARKQRIESRRYACCQPRWKTGRGRPTLA